MADVVSEGRRLLRERARFAEEARTANPYSHPVATGWYADDVPALLDVAEAIEAMGEEGGIDGGIVMFPLDMWESVRAALARLEGETL